MVLFCFVSGIWPAALSDGTEASPYVQKGFCYVSWSKDQYSSPYSDESMEQMAELGADHIAIVVTQYQDKYDSTIIYPTYMTPSDESLVHAINKAHELGLKVLLKPHIDLSLKMTDPYCRSDIYFYNDHEWKKWFVGYESFISHYAKIAASTNVEIFCIGTELSATTHKESSWRDLISKIREIYSGDLVYAANWDNYDNVHFWDDLDFVGIDAYFPLSNTTNPSISQIKRGWEKWKSEIRSFYIEVQKPILFTEIGYASIEHAPVTPWKNGTHGNALLEMQEKCYRAFFDVMWGCSWLEGVYWWKWNPSTHAGGKHNRRFTPQKKPAQEVIKVYYKEKPSPLVLPRAKTYPKVIPSSNSFITTETGMQ